MDISCLFTTLRDAAVCERDEVDSMEEVLGSQCGTESNEDPCSSSDDEGICNEESDSDSDLQSSEEECHDREAPYHENAGDDQLAELTRELSAHSCILKSCASARAEELARCGVSFRSWAQSDRSSFVKAVLQAGVNIGNRAMALPTRRSRPGREDEMECSTIATGNTDGSEQQRQSRFRASYEYRLLQQRLCKEAFMLVVGISSETIKTAAASVIEDGFSPTPYRHFRTNHAAGCSTSCEKEVCMFIESYATEHGFPCPGARERQRSRKKSKQHHATGITMHLPRMTSKKANVGGVHVSRGGSKTIIARSTPQTA